MYTDKILELNDTSWVHEDRLKDIGVNELYFKRLNWKRRNHQGYEYLACELKGLLLSDGVINKNGDYNGCVDPVKLVMTLVNQDKSLTVDELFERLESNPVYWVEYVSQNNLYRGIKAEKVSQLYKNFKRGGSLDDMVLAGQALKESIPTISINSTNMNPFQALAFIMENAGKMEPEDIAYHVGEDPTKVELLLYKNDRLILNNHQVRDRIEMIQGGKMEHQKKEVQKSPKTFTDLYGDMSITEFLKKTDISYRDMILLTRAGLLEEYTSVNSDYSVEKRISARSVVYHLRQIISGDERYIDQVRRVLSNSIDPYPRLGRKESRAFDEGFKYARPSFQTHIKEILKIPLLTEEEESEHITQMNNYKKSIEAEIASTDMIKKELDRVYGYAVNKTKGFIKAFLHKLRQSDCDLDTLRASYIKRYDILSELYKKKEVSGTDEVHKDISDIVNQLDLRFKITQRALKKLKNQYWDLKILDQQIRCYEKENELIDSLDEKDTQLGRKVRVNKNILKKLSLRKKDMLDTLEFNQEELEQKMGRIIDAEANIEYIREEFIMRNTRLALKNSKVNPRSYSYAIEGIIRAIDLFDPSKGYRFSTYATYWIRQNMTRGFHDTSKMIRNPVHAWGIISKINKAELDYMHENGRAPTPDEHWKAYNTVVEKEISFRKFNNFRIVAQSTLSLDDKIDAGNSYERNQSTRISFINSNSDGCYHYMNPEQKVVKDQMRSNVEEVLSELTKREAQVLKMRFGIGYIDHTLEEVGDDFSVTRERVRQIEAKALRKLRHPKKSRRLKPFS